MPDKLENRRIPYFGDFVLFDEIGRGGMGVVYNAHQSSLDRPVALKVLHSNIALTDAAVQRFRIEAEAAARLDHPNIVPIYEIGENEGLPYLAMQLVEGESLAERIARLGQNSKEKDAAALMAKIARAVAHAHQRGVLHRDLKPANIVMDASDEPHLIDFGLAKCVEQDSGMSATGTFLGTPAYASPEQVAGKSKAVTTATDIYSLGAVLYAILTGRPPFAGDSISGIMDLVKNQMPLRPRFLRPGLSPNLETICLKCLAKEPPRRYATAQDLAEDLENFNFGRPISARPVTTLERSWMWIRRNPAYSALLALLVLSIATAIAALAQSNLSAKADLSLRLAMLQKSSGITREMSWRENAFQHLVAARRTTDQMTLRTQVAATCEGLAARELDWCSAPSNQQVFFVNETNVLLMGTKNVITWQAGSSTATAFTTNATPAGRLIASAAGTPLQVFQSQNGELHVWNASDRRVVCALESRDKGRPTVQELRVLCAASSDGEFLALESKQAGGGSEIVCWRLTNGKRVTSLRLDAGITSLAASDHGEYAACGNTLGNVSVFDTATAIRVKSLSASSSEVCSLALRQDTRRVAQAGESRPGYLLAAGDAGGTTRIWDLGTELPPVTCRGGSFEVTALAFSPDNMILASGGRGPVRLWDVATGEAVLGLRSVNGRVYVDFCESLAFSRDGLRLAASTWHKRPVQEIWAWELERGAGLDTLRGLASCVTRVAFAPNGEMVAAVSMDWEVGVWDLRHRKLLHRLQIERGRSADNCGLAFSQSGRQLAVSAGKKAQLWDMETGRPLWHWDLNDGLVDFLAFTTNGDLLLLREEARNCLLRVLLPDGGHKMIWQSGASEMRVLSAAVSPDGKYFAVDRKGLRKPNTNHIMFVIESATGSTVWQTNSVRSGESGSVDFAARGALLTFDPGTPTPCVVDLDSPGKSARLLPAWPLALSPGGGVWMAGPGLVKQSFGRVLVESHQVKMYFRLEGDGEESWHTRFDPSGRFAAWGNVNGAVTVCDLEKIRSQVEKLKVKW